MQDGFDKWACFSLAKRAPNEPDHNIYWEFPKYFNVSVKNGIGLMSPYEEVFDAILAVSEFAKPRVDPRLLVLCDDHMGCDREDLQQLVDYFGGLRREGFLREILRTLSTEHFGPSAPHSALNKATTTLRVFQVWFERYAADFEAQAVSASMLST